MGYCPLHPQFGFNTQPPEGGWTPSQRFTTYIFQFQHTAARRRLDVIPVNFRTINWFQHTAARRRLADLSGEACSVVMFQHTAARRRLDALNVGRQTARVVSTHSRPKAAGSRKPCSFGCCAFQHTAARRRLVGI